MPKQIPVYIKNKIIAYRKHMQSAQNLLFDIETWMTRNGIDPDTCYDNYIYDDTNSLPYDISIRLLQEYLEDTYE